MSFLIIFIVALAVAVAVQPKQPTPKPAGLADINVPTAEPGRPVQFAFGEVVLEDPNVVWYGDLTYRKIKTKSGK